MKKGKNKLAPLQIKIPRPLNQQLANKAALIDHLLMDKPQFITQNNQGSFSKQYEPVLNISRRSRSNSRSFKSTQKRVSFKKNSIQKAIQKATLSSSRLSIKRQQIGVQRDENPPAHNYSARQLQKYDIGQLTDRTGEQLIRIYKDKSGPHCYCKMLQKYDKYQQKQFRLIGYQNGKYQIQLCSDKKIIRSVQRLAVRFIDDDPNQFKLRVQKATKLLMQAQQQYRYQKIVYNLQGIFPSMPKEWIARVSNILKVFQPDNAIFDEVRQNYNRMVKKIHLMGSSQKEQIVDLFKKNRVRFRQFIPKSNSKRLNLPKTNHLKMQLQQRSIYKKKIIIQILRFLKKKNTTLDNLQLFIKKFNKTISLEQYKQQQLQYQLQTFEKAVVKWKNFIITDVEAFANQQIKNEIVYAKVLDFQFFSQARNWIQRCQRNFQTYISEFDTKHSIKPIIKVSLKTNVLKSPKKSKRKKNDDILEFIMEPQFQIIRQSITAISDGIVSGMQYFKQFASQFVVQYKTNLDWIQPIVRNKLDLNNQFNQINRLCNLYKQHQHFLKQFKFDYLKDNQLTSDMDISLIMTKIQQINQQTQIIRQKGLSIVHVGIFQLDMTQARQILLQRAHLKLKRAGQAISKIIQYSLSHLKVRYQQFLQIASGPLTNQQQLVTLKNFYKSSSIQIQKCQKLKTSISSFLLMVQQYFLEVDDQIYCNFFELVVFPAKMQVSLTDLRNNLKSRQESMTRKLDSQRIQLSDQIDNIELDVKECGYLIKLDDYNLHANQVGKVSSYLQIIKDTKSNLNSRQILLNQQPIQYPKLQIINNAFQPLQELWQTVFTYFMDKNQWFNTSLILLSYQKISRRINQQFIKQLIKLSKHFNNLKMQQPISVCNQFKQEIDSFKQQMWILQSLTCQGMVKKPHYYKQIFQITGKQPVDIKQMTLNLVIQSGLSQSKDQIQQISQKAQRIWGLQKRLNQLSQKIRSIPCDLFQHGKSQTYLLKGIEDARILLDDSYSQLLFLKSNPLIKTLIIKLTNLDNKIILMQDTYQALANCQKGWLYLYPIFSSPDIQRQMPQEKKKFDQIDKIWRVQMQMFKKQSFVADVIQSQSHKIKFENGNVIIQDIMGHLSQYLQQKRLAFSRFFFLSDDQLIDILSKARDPLIIQHHINKCFQAITKLGFNQSVTLIQSMYSEQEVVPFQNIISLQQVQKRNYVQIWLKEIQREMRLALNAIQTRAIQDQKTRDLWLMSHPAQIILSVNMQRWTSLCQQRINNLTKVLIQLSNDLSLLVQLVRKPHTQSQKTLLSSIVTLDVHNKDVVSNLIKQGNHTISDFSWTANLRYYRVDQNTVARMVGAQKAYSYQYLGNSPRLVITPLTDRCYRTLFGAYSLYYGGAPQGPAGTGKTQTVKDLAKAIAAQCIVFNCSQGLNYLSMRKFFKGLSSSGAWCCFDEFNRIDLQVLSVIAQQIYTIQQAIKAKKKLLILDGFQVQLLPGCTINITMNPGYAGRSQLPDNLKDLFRPCPMMVPDYALIAQIYLYSLGFQNGRELAKKIVVSLRLSSQQLSSQDHYDFGMRALKSVLVAAGQLFSPQLQESIVCLNSLLDVNLPKFTIEDIPLFTNIISDLFPTYKIQQYKPQNLQILLQNYAKQKKLATGRWIQKCIQLWATIKVRHGIMLTGQALSGKTQASLALASAVGLMSQYSVQISKINPKSVTLGQLFGSLDPNSNAFSQGIVSKVLRNCVQKSNRQWIIFDGAVDAVWIQNMNTVLDDNKKLCLTSGQIIKLNSLTSMLFENDDLSKASPATVSRCGMVFFQSNLINWQAHLHNKLDKQLQQYQNTMLYILSVGFQTLQTKSKSQCIIAATFAQLANIIFKAYKIQQQQKLLNYLIFCMVWAFAPIIPNNKRDHFSRQLCSKLIHAHTIGAYHQYAKPINLKKPEDSTIFELQYNSKKKMWVQWAARTFFFPKDTHYAFRQLIVPTNQSVCLQQTCKIVLPYKSILVVGPTGTSKTTAIKQALKHQFNNQKKMHLLISMSGQTTPQSLQKNVQIKINCRKRLGLYGPDGGKDFCAVFIDQLNMPAKDKFGSQPTLQLLRQCIQQNGWYCLESKNWRGMTGASFLGAMQQQYISSRLRRQFYEHKLQSLTDNSLTWIYQNIIQWHFGSSSLAFSKEVTDLQPRLVSASINLYNKVRKSKELRPKPSKSHYVYNMRDISKLFEGLMKSNSNSIKKESLMIQLWIHEARRCFRDRLVSNDKKYFQELLKGALQQKIKCYLPGILNQPLLFYKISQNYNKTSTQQIKKILQQSNLNLGMALFLQAIQHLLRAARIIQAQQSHQLLLGISGSGKRTIARLASKLVFDIQPFQMTQGSWDQQLSKILKNAGLNKRDCCLLIHQQQLKTNRSQQHISSLLNRGQVFDLFSADDKTKIAQQIQGAGSIQQKYNLFVTQCRKNLRMQVALSPISSQFTTRIRNFPSYVNCCTIDWYQSWPILALQQTAVLILEQSQQKKSLCKLGPIMHIILQQKMYLLTACRRHFTLSPSHFLQFLNQFNSIKKTILTQNQKQLKRYQTGKMRILEAQVNSFFMKALLGQLQPLLINKKKSIQQLLARLDQKKSAAGIQQQKCKKDQEACNKQRAQATRLSQQCRNQLDKVLPLLNNAAQALQKITKDDMILLKSFSTPPISAAVVMQGMCYVFGQDHLVKKKAGSDMVQQFWQYSKKNILNDKLIKRVMQFRQEKVRAIPQKNIINLKQFIKKPQFQPAKVQNASTPAYNLSMWVRAVLQTYEALLVVDPKKALLAQAELQLQRAELKLANKMQQLQLINNKVKTLQKQFKQAVTQKQSLQYQYDQVQLKLNRSQELLSGLAGQKASWTTKVKQIIQNKNYITSDCLIAAAYCIYLGPFKLQDRQIIVQEWMNAVSQQNLIIKQKFSISALLSNQLQISQWINVSCLANDKLSVDNAVIIKSVNKYPLAIDPQRQANRWIKQIQKKNNLIILRPNQLPLNKMNQKLQLCLQSGKPLLLQDIGEQINGDFRYVLLKKISKKGIHFGQRVLQYDPSFKLYISTEDSQPRYDSDLCINTLMVNFQVTHQGLTDQLLNLLIKRQDSSRDQTRQKNIKQNVKAMKQRAKIEDDILDLLAKSKGNLVKDDTLINFLKKSKAENDAIQQRQAKQFYQNQSYFSIKKHYTLTGNKISSMFFVLLEMAALQPSYRWSIQYFQQILLTTLPLITGTKDIRPSLIWNNFLKMFFDQISRGLLQKDILIYQLLIVLKLLLLSNKINSAFIKLLGKGPSLPQDPQKGNSILTAKQATHFQQFKLATNSNLSQSDVIQWIKFVQTPQKSKIQLVQQLLLTRFLVPDHFVYMSKNLIKAQLALEVPLFDLNKLYQISTANTPLIFILSTGSDPRLQIQKYAEKLKYATQLRFLSLGQGQGAIAKKMISQAEQQGLWVVLQNCHLSPSFMLQAQNILHTNKKLHPNYRLWLTTTSSSNFPSSIYLRGIKITYEPPTGLKNNMIRAFNNTEKWVQQANQNMKKLVYSLCFFHSVCLQRRKYGPMGWNIGYDFTIPDLSICLGVLYKESDNIDWKGLHYMIAQANYGGKVTDYMDRTLINTIIKKCIGPQTLQQQFKLANKFIIPVQSSKQDYLQRISNQIPQIQQPQYIGLGANVKITKALIDCHQLSNHILQVSPQQVQKINQLGSTITLLINQLPFAPDLQMCSKNHPIRYQQSMNSVIQQQSLRYTRLYDKIKATLQLVSLAIQGQIPVSNQIQQLFCAFENNKVPNQWSEIAYPSNKLLASWLLDFTHRIQFIQKWINNGIQKPTWLPGFYFIQSYLTGVLQNYARAYKVAIDTLQIIYLVSSEQAIKANQGHSIKGIYLQGASWDKEDNNLIVQQPGILIQNMPPIRIMVSQKVSSNKDYMCPFYRTSSRRGILSTTGHSTNLVCLMGLNPGVQKIDYWIMNGVALVSELND